MANSFLLLEDGGYLLQQDGVSKIILEGDEGFPVTTTGIDVAGKRRGRRKPADEELTEAEVQFMQRKLAELKAAKTKREEQAAAKSLEVALAQAAQSDEVAEVISTTIEAKETTDYAAVMRDLTLLSRVIDRLERMVREEREEDDIEILAMAL